MTELVPMDLNQILGRSMMIPGYTEDAEKNLAENKMLAVILLERTLGAAEECGRVHFSESGYPFIVARRGTFNLRLTPSQFGNMDFRLGWHDLLVFAAFVGGAVSGPDPKWCVHILAWDREPGSVGWEQDLFATFNRVSSHCRVSPITRHGGGAWLDIWLPGGRASQRA
jgi:hypothetical protein